MLNVKNLWVRYKSANKWVLQDITFKIERGKFVIVCGPSGSGKSTLAKALIGLIPFFYPAEIRGEIHIKNKSPLKTPTSELMKDIGYVPQYPSDYTTSLLVRDEIIFPLENMGYNSEEIEKRLERILSELEILHLKNRLVTELSAGEMQKVALATALAHEPEILILDEPFARLDPKSQRNFAQTLAELRQTGITIVIFEHRLDHILSLADFVLILQEGHKIGYDVPQKLIHHLQNIDLGEISSAFLQLGYQPPPLTLEEALQLVMNHENQR